MANFQRRQFLGLSAAALGLGAAAPVRLFANATAGSGGVAPEAISRFIQAASSRHEMHSLVIRRHGAQVVAGWWAPYRAGAVHSLYSLSKSFTSTAVGFAVTEKRFKVTDRVIDFFPDQRPAQVGDHLAALRIQDLLTMSVGHAADSTPVITRQDDWISAFLALPIEQAPGSVFLYNSGATYMLSAILQKVCGVSLIDYLRPRLLDPLGISDARWAVCPRGINTGGWGLSTSTDSIASFGQFYLQQGQWRGRQLLSRQWIEEATSFKIQQPGGAPPNPDLAQLKQLSDWHQGYAYQFWRCRHDAYRGDGAFGQFCIVLPRQDAVIAMTSMTPDMQGLLNLVWEHLLPGMSDGAALDPLAVSRLSGEVGSLGLPVPKGSAGSASAARLRNKQFDLEQNALGLRSMSLRFDGQSSVFELHAQDSVHSVTCGLGQWRDGVTTMPGVPPEFSELIGRTSSLPLPIKVAAAGAWTDENTFVMQWRYYETPHHDTVTCRFDADRVRVEFVNNLTAISGGAHPEIRPALSGRLASQ